jgi:hypothetical protein
VTAEAAKPLTEVPLEGFASQVLLTDKNLLLESMEYGTDDFSCGSVIAFAAIYGHYDKKIALEAVPYLKMIAIHQQMTDSVDPRCYGISVGELAAIGANILEDVGVKHSARR